MLITRLGWYLKDFPMVKEISMIKQEADAKKRFFLERFFSMEIPKQSPMNVREKAEKLRAILLAISTFDET